jgi:hypothetical protein
MKLESYGEKIEDGSSSGFKSYYLKGARRMNLTIKNLHLTTKRLTLSSITLPVKIARILTFA